MKSILKKIIPNSAKHKIKDIIRRLVSEEIDKRERESSPLPFLLDTQENRLLYKLFGEMPARCGTFTQYKYVFELFKDLSNEHKLLKKSVLEYCISHVCFEISSYCNRQCQYCPCSLINRKEKNDKMSMDILSSVVNSLSEINYRERLSYNLFNEPLADREFILECINFVRSRLPYTYQILGTNGDFLTNDYLEALFDSKIDELVVSVHYSGIWDKTKQFEKALHMLKKWGIKEKYHAEEYADGNCFIIVVDTSVYNSKYTKYFALRSENFAIQGMDRGGALNSFVPKNISCNPCPTIMQQLNISHDGYLVPCCQICSDIETAKPYLYGRIGDDGDIFDIFTNAKASAFRKSLFSKTNDLSSRPDICLFCGGGTILNNDESQKRIFISTKL